MSTPDDVSFQLHQRGWAKVKLPRPEPVFQIRHAVLAELRRLVGDDKVTLEDYHRLELDEDRHTEIQFQLTTMYRQRDFARKIAEPNLSLLTALAGGDLDIQTQPFLRITRPGRPQDNVGYHRDTFYGDSPWALNISVPFVTVPAEAALCMLSGSHVWQEADVPFVQEQSADVSKGSVRHQLGFVYAPKLIDPEVTARVEPVALELGHAVVFSGAIVHGTAANNAATCRWTSDVRFINALAPYNENQRDGYYAPLCRTAMTRVARTYEAANHAPSKAA
jgi:hypothetical protein